MISIMIKIKDLRATLRSYLYPRNWPYLLDHIVRVKDNVEHVRRINYEFAGYAFLGDNVSLFISPLRFLGH